MQYDVIQTDVLVIGAGGAGAKAALEASNQGAKVILAIKGKLGASGTTCHKVSNTSGLQAVNQEADPDDSIQQHYEDIVNAGRGMCNPSLARIVAENAPRIVSELEKMGIVFSKKEGRKLVFKGCYSTRFRAHSILGHGHSIVQALKARILESEVKILEDVYALDLLTDGNQCIGAMLVNEDGQPLCVQAKATILATGGAGQLFKYCFNPYDVTGDGYAMGFRAGAKLANMEFVQMGFGLVNPGITMLSSPIWWYQPNLFNAHGLPFLASYLPQGLNEQDVYSAKVHHFPFSTYDIAKYLDISLISEVKAGRGTERDGVYLDFSASPENPKDIWEADERRWASTLEMLAKKGIDAHTMPLEVSIFLHAFNGGLVIDENAQTSLEGLYAIGETATGPHGADRLGGNMLVTSQVFGEIAGKHAAKAACQKGNFILRDTIVKQAIVRMSNIEKTEGKKVISLSDLLARMRRNAWDVMVIREERALREMLGEIDLIENELLPRAFIVGSKNMKDYFELQNLLLVGRLFTEAALLRRESRGSHYRKDFPQENPDMARPLISQLVNGKMKIEFGLI